MKIKKILNKADHRPWKLPEGRWKFYQEWNNAIFLHWQVDEEGLRKYIPHDIEIDLFEDKPWVSLVAFTMEKIRPRNFPAFSPISNFDEINIRTYVRYKGKPGVYFISIEGGTKISCQIAKRLSKLPYRHSKMVRTENTFVSNNSKYKDALNLGYTIGSELNNKSELDKWLIERYALFQDTKSVINEFEIHHLEWPTNRIDLNEVVIDYARLEPLIRNNKPSLCHYSEGVQVFAWGKKSHKKTILKEES